jgi:hypothetical protein
MLTDTWETAACPPKDHSVGEAAGACEADQSPASSEATPPLPLHAFKARLGKTLL